MILPLQLDPVTEASLQIANFLQQSSGKWHSQRRYYTLPDGGTKEMISLITVCFLEQGCAELQHLAELHDLSHSTILTCGAKVTWESTDLTTERQQSEGSMMFGVAGKILYRDRSFTTGKPIAAEYYLANPKTLCLRTEQHGSVFEEELKLISHHYRTRQTIISRAGKQQIIGQYLETRILD